jgi:hypothetical protein
MANSNTTQAIAALAADIGESVYIEVAKWHLYLSDAHLDKTVAEKAFALIEDQAVSSSAIAEILQDIKVPIGGGKQQVSLSELIPSVGQAKLFQILEDAQQEN